MEGTSYLKEPGSICHADSMSSSPREAISERKERTVDVAFGSLMSDNCLRGVTCDLSMDHGSQGTRLGGLTGGT